MSDVVIKCHKSAKFHLTRLNLIEIIVKRSMGYFPTAPVHYHAQLNFASQYSS